MTDRYVLLRGEWSHVGASYAYTPRMASTSTKRAWYAQWACKGSTFPVVSLLGSKQRVNPETVDAWAAFDRTLRNYRYVARSVGVYNCRKITGGSGYSLHSYGIAADIDPSSNPYLRVRQFDWNRTDFTKPQVDAVLDIKTNTGKTVFMWGGYWATIKDYMHWEIDVSPNDLRSGINVKTVDGGETEEEVLFKQGDEGFLVAVIQKGLKAKGYDMGAWKPWSPVPSWYNDKLPLGADGQYGPTTVLRVKAFQASAGLPQTGVVGPTEFSLLTET